MTFITWTLINFFFDTDEIDAYGETNGWFDFWLGLAPCVDLVLIIALSIEVFS
ncbi:MAG: hypothetical protein AB7G80_09230 [Dongiaceae bacterium]